MYNFGILLGITMLDYYWSGPGFHDGSLNYVDTGYWTPADYVSPQN